MPDIDRTALRRRLLELIEGTEELSAVSRRHPRTVDEHAEHFIAGRRDGLIEALALVLDVPHDTAQRIFRERHDDTTELRLAPVLPFDRSHHA